MSASSRSGVSLKVMSFNIRYGTADDGFNHWQFREPRTLALISDYMPDLLGVQEALDFQLNAVHEHFDDLEKLGVGRDDGHHGGEHTAIFFNRNRLRCLQSGTFWLSDTPEEVGSRTWGNRVVRICTWGEFELNESGKRFIHLNTHLDHESQVARRNGIQLVLDRAQQYASGLPVLITGDFNVHEDDEVLDAARLTGYRDSFRVHDPNATSVGTFNGWNETADPEKIDYILVNDSFTVREASIVRAKVNGGWGSDHFPVTAHLEL